MCGITASGDCAAAVIAAAREWPLLVAGLGESGGSNRAAAPGDGTAPHAVRDLYRRRPAGPAQYQALAMLAGAVLWLGRAMGRPEMEVVDEIAGSLASAKQAAYKRDGTRPVALSGGRRADTGSGMKVIEAVRELLSCVPVRGGPAGRPDAAPGGTGVLPAVTALVRDPAVLALSQSVALLAGVVTILSRESGRPEAEILDELAASLRLST